MQDKNKKPMNDNGEWHGYWERYYDNGLLDHKGLFINDKRYGYHEDYWSNGNLHYKCNFINSEVYGYYEIHWGNKIKKEYYAR
jgi:antitoxin component YwqK of YwqJK toxin-antitoxin module